MPDFIASLCEHVTSWLHFCNPATTGRRAKIGDFSPVFFWTAPQQTMQPNPLSQSSYPESACPAKPKVI